MYQTKPCRVEAYRVRADGMSPQWLIEYINAGTVYWQGGDNPHYTIVMKGVGRQACVGDWIVYTSPLEVYTDAGFLEKFEEVS